MRISKIVLMGSMATMMALPSAGFAQANAQPATTAATGQDAGTTANALALAQGATVFDANGGTVGTVDALDGDYAVVATGKNKVRLPKSSFAMGAKGPAIAMTAAQLDQAAAQAAPQAGATATAASKPNIVKGAAVADTQGGAVGTIADVDSQFATVTLTTGGKVRLPVTAFGADEKGALRVAMTAAQLSAAAGAATPAKGG